MKVAKEVKIYFMDIDYHVIIYEAKQTPVGLLYSVKVDGVPHVLKRIPNGWQATGLNEEIVKKVGEEIGKLSMY